MVKVEGLEELLKTAVKEQGFSSLEDYFERGKALEGLVNKKQKYSSSRHKKIFYRINNCGLELFYLNKLVNELENKKLLKRIKPVLKPSNPDDINELVRHYIALNGYEVKPYCRGIASRIGMRLEGLKDQISGKHGLSLHNFKVIAEDLQIPEEYVKRHLLPKNPNGMKELVRHYIKLNVNNIHKYCKKIEEKTGVGLRWLEEQISERDDLSLFVFKVIAEDLQIPKEYTNKFLLPENPDDINELVNHYIGLVGENVCNYCKRIAQKTNMSVGGLNQQISGIVDLSLFNFKIIAEDLKIPEEYTRKHLLPKISDDMNGLVRHYIELNGYEVKPYCHRVAKKIGMSEGGLQEQIYGRIDLSLFNFKVIAEDLHIPEEYTNRFLIRQEPFKNLKDMLEWYADLNTPHSPRKVYSLLAEKTNIASINLYWHVKTGKFPNNEILYQLIKAVNAPYDIVKQVTGFDVEKYERIKAKESECFKELKRQKDV